MQSESLYFNKIGVTSFLISLGKLTECYFKLLLTNSATWQLLSFIFHESISVDMSKRFMCYYVTFGHVAKM